MSPAGADSSESSPEGPRRPPHPDLLQPHPGEEGAEAPSSPGLGEARGLGFAAPRRPPGQWARSPLRPHGPASPGDTVAGQVRPPPWWPFSPGTGLGRTPPGVAGTAPGAPQCPPQTPGRREQAGRGGCRGLQWRREASGWGRPPRPGGRCPRAPAGGGRAPRAAARSPRLVPSPSPCPCPCVWAEAGGCLHGDRCGWALSGD